MISKKWGECQVIADYLNVDKNRSRHVEKKDVFYNVYDKLRSEDILNAALMGDKDALKRANQILDEKFGVKVQANEGIKLALWYVGKFTTPYEAMAALKKAFKVLDIPLTPKKVKHVDLDIGRENLPDSDGTS